MNIDKFLTLPVSVIVVRNSVDFDVEIIGYVPATAEMQKFLNTAMDLSIIPASLPLMMPTRFTYDPDTDAFEGEPLASWDPLGKKVLAIAPAQCFYISEATQALKAAFMAAVPFPEPPPAP